MTKKIASLQHITLVSLLNTLTGYLQSLNHRNASWLRNKEFAYCTLAAYKAAKEWHRDDVDFLEGRIIFNEAMVVVEALVSNLKFALESNPYPGEQKRLVPLAAELFPHAAVVFQPKNAPVQGVGLWVKIFDIGGIAVNERITFPVKVAEIDVENVEKMLWGLVREDNTILASDIPRALNLAPTCKQYFAIKQQLEERNWVWLKRRKGTKTERIVTPPV